MLRVIFSLLTSVSALFALSQISIKGIVIGDNEPVFGANVVVKNTSLGSITDFNGKFEIDCPNKESIILQVSYIGYESKEIPVQINNKQQINIGRITLIEGIVVNEVVVKAEMKDGEKKAVKQMLESQTITQVKSAELIARLPDKNAAEALQRLPGVVMESDHGEGQYISFRGTPTDWSSVTINGNRLPVANEEVLGRALNLDVLPTSLLDYIEYNQSLLPNIEADAIGGNANFLTRNIPDEFTLEAEVAAGFNFKAKKPLYNVSFLSGGRTKKKKLGFVGGASYFARNWSTDNFEIFYGSNTDQSLTRLELRKYNGVRTTAGAHFKMDYQPNDKNTFYLMGFSGLMMDNEYNRKIMYNWSTGVGQSIRIQNIHNILKHQTYGVSLGAENKIGKKLKLDWELSSYASSFGYGNVPFAKGDGRNGYYVLEYEKIVEFTDFLYLDENGNQVTINDDYDQRIKLLDIDSPVEGYGDAFSALNPTYRVNQNAIFPGDTGFIFTKAYSETNANRESDPIVARLNLNYKAKSNLNFTFGAKYRYKTGTRDIGLEAWQRNPFSQQILTYDQLSLEDIPHQENFLQELNSNYNDLQGQYVVESQLNSFIQDYESELTYLPFGTSTPFYPQFVGSSFTYDEHAASAFAMAEWKFFDKFNLAGGMRFEYTNATVNADSVYLNVTGTGDTEPILTTLTTNTPYVAILPMMTAKWKITKNLKLVYATSRTYRRVNFNEIKPGQPEIHYTHFHLLEGNPSLKPTYAINNDLSLQKYFSLNGYASIGLFHKYVTNHIYTSFKSDVLSGNTTAGNFLIPGGVVAKRYENAPKANVYGFELALEGNLGKIKVPVLKHFGLGTNYSFTDSKMDIPSRDKFQPLTRQAKHVVNARISFENNFIMANLGLNYRSPYLLELNLFAYTDPVSGETIVNQTNEFDVFMGRSLGLDASIKYKFKKNYIIGFELMNLLNTEYVEYRGQRERPTKTEYYGIRGLLSFKYTLGAIGQQSKKYINFDNHNHNHNH